MESVESLYDVKKVEGLIQALKDPDYAVRKEATQDLKKIGDSQAVDALIESLKYENWQDDYIILDGVRSNSAEALGNIGDPKAIPYLIQSLDQDPYEEVRAKSAWALGKLNAKEAVDALIKALYDEDWEVRKYAANSLGIIGDQNALPYLIEILNDPDRQVRQYAAVALGKMKDERAISILLESMDDEDDNVKLISMYALENMGEKAVGPLTKTLKDKDWRIRANAAIVLGKIGDEKAQKSLSGALKGMFNKDRNNYVRGKAAEALGNIGSEKAINSLTKALKDEDKYVRDKASLALQKIAKNTNKPSIWTYENAEVSFEFTDNWDINNIQDKKKLVKGHYDNYDNKSITLSINRETEVTDISLKEFAEMLKEVFSMQNTKLMEELEFKRDEMEGYMLMGENQNVGHTHIFIVSFKKDDLLYYMWFAGDPAAFPEAEDEINLIVNSFYIHN
jgi:HEAT repeat protein